MEDFKSQLQAYIEGRVTLAHLQQRLKTDLRQSPEIAAVYHRALFGMLQQKVLPEAVYQSLASLIETFDPNDLSPDDGPQRDDDRTLVGPGPVAEAEDQTRVGPGPGAKIDDQTRISPQPMPQGTAEGTSSEPPLTKSEDQPRWGALPEADVQTSSSTGVSQWRKPFYQGPGTAPLGVGSVLKERFRLVEFIGYGGMGDVYKAEDSRRMDADDADPLVAIKVLNKTFRDHPESLRALQRETRKTQHLAHPNIINVFDFDRDRDNVFMTMELMKGRPLNEEIKAHPRGFALVEVLNYILGMAEALKYAHHKGVIHSDFKPSNVFVHQGVIKVFDFGIARAAKAGQHESGSVAATDVEVDSFDAGSLGALTPSYASPEMLDTEEWAPAPEDDIYALGCITYELLTGQHPFREGGQKVPGNVACAQGLKPVRIKQLSRGQWKALQRTLSFQRQLRTPCVQDFIDDFMPTEGVRSLTSRWLFWPGAVVLIVGAAYFPVQALWQQRQVNAFVERLDSGSEAQITAQLAEIETYGITQRDLYFNDVRVKEALANFFVTRFEQQAAEDQYHAVDALIAQANRIYEDSRHIAEQTEVISKRRAQRLNELNAELTQILDADLEGFILTYRQLQPLLKIIRQVDRNSPMLRDPRAPVQYLAAVRAFGRQHDYAPAMAMLTVALTQFPERQDFLQEQLRLTRERKDYQRQQRIGELQQLLTRWNEQPVELDQSAEALTPLIELLELDAANPVALTARKRLMAALEAAIEPQLAANRWAPARQLLGQFSGALDLLERERLVRTIEQHQYAYEDGLKRLLRAINKAARSGNLGTASEDSALSLLSVLQQSAAAPSIVHQAQERIARGHLRQARLERSQQHWNAARGQLQAARALEVEGKVKGNTPLQTALEQELVSVTEAEARAQDGSPGEASLATEPGIAVEIAQLYQDFDASLLAPDELSLPRSEQALALLDQIEQLVPQEPRLNNARLQIAARYLKDAQTLVDRERLQEALVLAERGAGMIPESAALESQIDSVQQALQQHQQQLQYQRLLGVQQELQVAADARTLTPAWEKQLLTRLIEFEAQQGDPDFSRRLRQQLSQDLLDQAQTLRIDKQFDRALEALGSARRFDPEIDGLVAEAESIEQAEQRYKTAQAEAREKAAVEGAKQSFSTQIAANDIRQAKKTLNSIANKLNSEGLFISQEVPEAFASAYLRLAAQQAKRQRYQDASQLIAAGLHYTPGSVTLISKQAEYGVQLDIKRFLRDAEQAGADDLEPLQQSLGHFKESVSGGRYKKLQATLYARLLKRIQVLQTVDAPAAAHLLSRAQRVFPNAAAFSDLVLNSPPEADMVASPAAGGVTAQQPTATPASSLSTSRPVGRPCSPQLAGYGSRSRAICYDMLDAQLRAPYMVVLPQQGDEQLAISKFEISIADYNRYCALSEQCSALSSDPQLPVTGLSSTQIEGYTRWLTERTGFSYRLPSLAEWQYAARATDLEQPQDFNCRLTQGGTVLKGRSLVAVKAGQANAWGVVNYLGNAQELVSQGGQLMAAGGHHQDRMSECAITLSRSAIAKGDGLTGLRLLKEI
ncbi:MAG: hypothetical protein ACJAWL_002833 [Motiliproteus sp.]|jgi:hypothetical protein